MQFNNQTQTDFIKAGELPAYLGVDIWLLTFQLHGAAQKHISFDSCSEDMGHSQPADRLENMTLFQNTLRIRINNTLMHAQ